jgi:hypothetical protein
MKRQSAHVDAGVLAELSAGLISGRRAARIHAHLAGCQRCARVGAGLSEVSALLASVPEATMPAAVTRRLSTAIADEAAARPGTAGTPVRLAGGEPFRRAERTGRAGSGRSRNRLASPVAARGFAAAAAVCLVAAGGYTIVQLTSPGQSGPGLSPGASAGIHPRNGGNKGAGPFNVSPTHQGNAIRPSSLSPASPPVFSVITSGTDYQRATLRTQVDQELGQISRIGTNTAPGEPARHQPTAQQEACVENVVPGWSPTLVDAARYQGHPATIIALAPGAGQLAQAWVVGPACSADTNDILAHVRLSSAGG